MSEEIKKGLLGIVVDETTISHVVPELSALTYRGYTVQELCDKCDFEEVAYLVLNGELPNNNQLKKFIKKERSERKLSKQILNDKCCKIFGKFDGYSAGYHKRDFISESFTGRAAPNKIASTWFAFNSINGLPD